MWTGINPRANGDTVSRLLIAWKTINPRANRDTVMTMEQELRDAHQPPRKRGHWQGPEEFGLVGASTPAQTGTPDIVDLAVFEARINPRANGDTSGPSWNMLDPARTHRATTILPNEPGRKLA